MGNNIILETKFVADIRGSFYISLKQRLRMEILQFSLIKL